MKVYLDCIPCHIRSAINSAKLLTSDAKLIEKTTKEVLLKVAQFGNYKNHLELYRDVANIVKENIEGNDPYRDFKAEFNRICMDISNELVKKIEKSKNWFDMALRVCLAGNSIDVMQGKKITKKKLLESIDAAILQKLDKENIKKFKQELIKAEEILYIGDNAGEIVFDRIFIQFLNEKLDKKGRITYAVRGGPALNDCTVEDALMVGMEKFAKIITTGVDMPAAHLPRCSEEFKKAFASADLIISKGQGNLEALLEEKGNIFFLLKVKCPVIAKIFNHKHSVDDIVIEHSFYFEEWNSSL
ncbi:MAG: DUF89 family protein [Actinobacteria bacterium]|nr:DUF89 family protein [Actinomycetota bacterium]